MRGTPTEQDFEGLVTVVATHTRDVFTEADGTTWTMPGGPARYILQAFQLLDVACNLITGDVAESHVMAGPHGEEYRIDAIAPIALPSYIDSAAVVLSPIVQEIDPANVPVTNGLVIVDLQGFVREPGISSACVTSRFDLSGLFARCDVVKASEAELTRLTESSLDALASCILLTTLGHAGLYVRVGGKEHHVAGERVDTQHTVGAGDTFLAGFVAALLNDPDPVRAATSAARFTERVLRERQ